MPFAGLRLALAVWLVQVPIARESHRLERYRWPIWQIMIPRILDRRLGANRWPLATRFGFQLCLCYTTCFTQDISIRLMLLSKEYVGYLAREVTKKLIAGEFIETKAVPAVTEKVHAAMLEELSLEDRINDEVRVILEAYSDEMQQTGANYQEMFRKVKSELVRKYKAVL